MARSSSSESVLTCLCPLSSWASISVSRCWGSGWSNSQLVSRSVRGEHNPLWHSLYSLQQQQPLQPLPLLLVLPGGHLSPCDPGSGEEEEGKKEEGCCVHLRVGQVTKCCEQPPCLLSIWQDGRYRQSRTGMNTHFSRSKVNYHYLYRIFYTKIFQFMDYVNIIHI